MEETEPIIQTTTFTNPQIEPIWLPHQKDISFTPLPATYRTVLFVGLSIFLIILALIPIIIFFVQPADDAKLTAQILLWILFGWAIFAAFLMVRLWIVFPYRGYAVRQHDIVYKKGWLWRSITTIPFQRVQHCDIKQGLIERFFGLSRLNVYTAGGQQSDLRIPGLMLEQAEQFKQFILKTISLDDEEE